MTNKARQHLVKGSILCEAVDYTGKVEPLMWHVACVEALWLQVLREVETMKVAKKVNKGKTETVSMTIDGSIFSEYPGNKVRVGWVVL